jgi:hypothetical protein
MPVACFFLLPFYFFLAFQRLDFDDCFALFYAQLTWAGFLDPVTSSIPHHRPDWMSLSGRLIRGGEILHRKT